MIQNFLLIENIIEVIFLGLVSIASIAALAVNNVIHNLIMMSIVSLILTIIYLMLGAPDVAITEAAVGACLSTLIFLNVIKQTKSLNTGIKLVNYPLIILFSLIGIALVYIATYFPPIGIADNPIHTSISSYYNLNTFEDIGIPEIVTAILASYRGYDTLGETTVILTAGLGLLLLHRLGKRIE